LPHREVRVLVIERDGELLFEKRPSSGVWGGLWSLPECALDDDARAVVLTRFGADVDVRDALPAIEHGFTHYALTMHPQRLRASQWPQAVHAPELAWLTPQNALAAALPSPIRRLVSGLQGD
jgi:A/G-specific adenine glycosylase